MSEAVLISIRPEWCDKIVIEEKTIEVRKTRPKLKTPFKCYIYCTLPKYPDEDFIVFGAGTENARAFSAGGMVIGEFICDKIITVDCDSVAPFDRETKEYIDGETCMSREDLWEYSAGRCAYGWYISNLKIYDTPKPLSDFWVEGNQTYDCPQLTPLKRPPQSWCYVEELMI